MNTTLIAVVYVLQQWLNYFHNNKTNLYLRVETEKLKDYLEKRGFQKESFSTRQYPTYYRNSTNDHKYVCEGKCVIDVPTDKSCKTYPIYVKEAIMTLSEEEQVHPLSLLLDLLYK